jgi:hypothetical protein
LARYLDKKPNISGPVKEGCDPETNDTRHRHGECAVFVRGSIPLILKVWRRGWDLNPR